MKTKAVLFLLAVLAVLLCSCGRAGAIPGAEAADYGANITREQAIDQIKAISGGSGNADVRSIPDLDKVIDSVRYYFIRASFPSRMTAEYYVDSMEGKIFVAISGEFDINNPLPAVSISSGDEEPETVTEITAARSEAVNAIIETLGMTAQQVEEKFGDGYSRVFVNYDSYMEAFLYREQGFTVAFGKDGKVACVYCSEKIDIGGARSGMDFSQVQEKLGKTVYRQKWTDTPANAAYQIEYGLGGHTVVFFSRQSGGSNSIMCIR